MAELNYSKKRLEPIIAKYGIDVNTDKVFQAIITLFPGQTDYQMWALKAVYSKATSLDRLIYLKEWADENPTEISKLSRKNLVGYKANHDFVNLVSEINNLNAVILVKRVVSQFNTNQRHLLKETVLDPIEASPYNALANSRFYTFYKLFKDFETLPKHRQHKFISLMSAVGDLTAIKRHLENAIQESYEWNREDMLSYAQRLCPDVEVCYDNNNVVILRIPSFESSQKLCGNGRTSWCLTREASYFKNYTENNQGAQQFFLFDFNKKENHELAHIGFSVNPQKGINYAHSTRNNSLMGDQEIDGKRWNIHKVLEHHKIGKNVYIRLKLLKHYTWNKESFLNMLSNTKITAKQIDDNRFIVEIPDTKVFDFVAGHTLTAPNTFINANNKTFVVIDFGKDKNDEASVLIFVFAKDRYEVLSFNHMYDAYGMKSTEAAHLGRHNLTSDMFVKTGAINPDILLHKLIDEQNVSAATKLLAENPDVDPNTVFYGTVPVIKAITSRNPELFKALASHEKFDMNLTEGFGEPYLQFIMLYMETLVDDKKADLKPFFEMAETFINNEKYDINMLDLNGDAALHVACEMPELVPLVERLVADPKCDVNLKNEWGYTPLDVALDNEPVNMRAVKALLSREDIEIGKDTLEFAKEKRVDLEAIKNSVRTLAKEASKPKKTIDEDDYEDIFAKAFA